MVRTGFLSLTGPRAEATKLAEPSLLEKAMLHEHCFQLWSHFEACLSFSLFLSFSLALWLSAEVFRFKVVKVFLRLSHSSVILCHHVVYDISIRQGRWLRRTSLLDDTLQLCSSTT